MTHICVAKLTIIGSDNGLSPDRRQAIIWTNDGILLIEPLGTNFSEILIEILTFSFKKMRLKVSSAKRWPFCLGLNVLTYANCMSLASVIPVKNDRQYAANVFFIVSLDVNDFEFGLAHHMILFKMVNMIFWEIVLWSSFHMTEPSYLRLFPWFELTWGIWSKCNYLVL